MRLKTHLASHSNTEQREEFFFSITLMYYCAKF